VHPDRQWRASVLLAVLFAARTAGGADPPASAPSRAEDPTYEPEARPASESGDDASGTVPIDLPRYDGEALQREVPDLVVQTWPPPTRYIFALGSHYPLQVMGIGFGMEIYPVKFLRVDAMLSPGLSGAAQFVSFGLYAHLSVGLRLFGFEGSAMKTVTAPPKRRTPDEETPLFETSLPMAHAFLLELGMLTGNVARLKCTAYCVSSNDPASPASYTDPTYALVNPLLLYPMAGVRYVASSFASSKKQPGIQRSFLVQVWAHLLYEPFNDSNEALLWGDHSKVEAQRFGGQGGVSFPLCVKKCVMLSFTGGYLPGPAAPMFGFEFGS